MKIRWPPAPLGLGTPLNLAWPSSDARDRLRRSWWLVPVLGLLTPLLMLGVDQVFFDGASLDRVRAFGSEPLGFRALVVIYSAVLEELLYRVALSTLFAWFAYMALPRVASRKALAQWIGIITAALLFGVAHAGNLPDVPHPVLRAVGVNGVAGLILGWLYWWRGLESAILTHMTAIIVLYIIIPALI